MKRASLIAYSQSVKASSILCLKLSLILSIIAVDFAHAQEVNVTPAAIAYEELPELKASEILRPEILKGRHHQVQEDVPTYSGANRFTIDSDFGVFEAKGNAMLVRRINEINAIAKLKEVSRTDQYKQALAKGIMQWDYAARTKMAAQFAKAIQSQFKDKPARLVAITGMVSAQLRQELEADGYTVQDRLVPGPLK